MFDMSEPSPTSSATTSATTSSTTSAPIDNFIQRWQKSGAAERANYQLFLSELCDVLDLPRPDPARADASQNAYVFEKAVARPHGNVGFIDLYRRGCFVLEAKQGSDGVQAQQAALSSRGEASAQKARRKRGHGRRGSATWDAAMEGARQQAQRYARSLSGIELEGGAGEQGRPPLLIVVDVGASLALYSEFTRSGGTYVPFPDPASYRITLDELRDPAIRERLRTAWLEPMALDPTRRSARVTREIAERLARLARSLERDHEPEAVANFLMRCLFTMFAEDVGLLPERAFAQLLDRLRQNPSIFQPMIESLWQTMNSGGFSTILEQQIPVFNGGLFADPAALPLDGDQLQLLVEAAQADWREVEPAIFGTLLERALDPVERHKLGAHYTPRAYVERLVQPALLDPLRSEWESALAAAHLHEQEGKFKEALAEVDAFQQRLASLRVLDPACGSGNFLYVALELLKRLEGEVLEVHEELALALGGAQTALDIESFRVTPAQLLGIEVNPRAAAIAELVLWIGYLQWHFRTRGNVPLPSPIIRNHHNIDCRDALLAWVAVEPLLDEAGQPVTHWDGRTTRPHPVTGEPVPDETARTPALHYVEPRQALWPRADFIVGNPPFIGAASMRFALGDGYVEAVRRAYKSVPDSADYVMFWWHRAAEAVRSGGGKPGEARRFGFITTNSLRQTFNRRVVAHHLGQKKALALLFAVPDHPWVDGADGADVRIAMTVGAADPDGDREGRLLRVTGEAPGSDFVAEVTLHETQGKILPDLTIGANVASAVKLEANEGISNRGVTFMGAGFIISEERAHKLGWGRIDGLEKHIRPIRNGRDITASSREKWVIDMLGLTADEVQVHFPEAYQWLYERVKAERDAKRGRSKDADEYADNWWLLAKPRSSFRPALDSITRYIATPMTAKHRMFTFLDQNILPDQGLIAIALDDAYFLGVLSSRVHVVWALRAGGTLEDRPRYNNSQIFETFPFPDATPEQRDRIRDIAERLDAHRQRQQALHPDLTLTGMYNVLETLRSGQPLSAKERAIHERGLVSLLRQLHDELDAAVAAAYGWPAASPTGLADEEILLRLVELNITRAAEELAGHVRWLRPAYQAPGESQPAQSTLLADEAAVAVAPLVAPRAWPKPLAEQAAAVRALLDAAGAPVAPRTLSQLFGRASQKRERSIRDLLETLVVLGQARVEAGLYVAG